MSAIITLVVVRYQVYSLIARFTLLSSTILCTSLTESLSLWALLVKVYDWNQNNTSFFSKGLPYCLITLAILHRNSVHGLHDSLPLQHYTVQLISLEGVEALQKPSWTLKSWQPSQTCLANLHILAGLVFFCITMQLAALRKIP